MLAIYRHGPRTALVLSPMCKQKKTSTRPLAKLVGVIGLALTTTRVSRVQVRSVNELMPPELNSERPFLVACVHTLDPKDPPSATYQRCVRKFAYWLSVPVQSSLL